MKTFVYLLCSLWLSLAVHAAELKFEPATPIVEINKSITLSVANTEGTVKWVAVRGKIQGESSKVTYTAAGEVASDVVTVQDSAGNIGTLKVTATQTISLNGTNGQAISRDDYPIQALAVSEDGNTLWIGSTGGLEQREATTGKLITTFLNENSGLPDNTINTLLSDGMNGLWIGTGKGLTHLSAGNTGADDDDTWQVFNTDNSGLPNNNIFSLSSDNQGGLWVGTNGGGLAHYRADGQWVVFDVSNSGLPDNSIWALAPDNVGGLWIGTRKGGLAHHTVDGQWAVFNTANSSLPDNWIYTALNDNQEGVWLGASNGGLVHFKSDNTWTILNTTNSDLPSNTVQSLISDDQGGLWIGAGELVHLVADTQALTKFDLTNMGLSSKKAIGALVNDGKGGIWLGITGSIVRVTLDETVPEVVTGNRAAIIISGGSATDFLWESVEFASNRLYRTFFGRGSNNDEIYYLSPKSWIDFNGDGFNDRVVDAPNPERPLAVEDVRGAFEWAKTRGKLDQPLYVFFIGLSGTGKLVLDNNAILNAMDFKAILDDYQNTTGNQVIVVIDGVYSGSFLPVLASPNRAVISSAATEELSYYFERKGFNYFFANYLLKGASFLESFELASREQNKMLGKAQQTTDPVTGAIKTISQSPQLDDNGDGICTEEDGKWLEQVVVNGTMISASANRSARTISCGNRDTNLAVQELTLSSTLQAGQPIVLKAQTNEIVRRVWATLEPPLNNFALKTKSLELSVTSDANVWETTWNEAFYNGEYKITFQAESNSGNTTSSNQIVITVTGGLSPPQDRIAIIIAGGGSDSSNLLWKATESNANFIYKTFYDRGFRHEDIFYLSPKTLTDFDGNDQEDDIIDTPAPRGRPLTDKDLIAAFEWAKTRGKLGQPLYLFFLDHGDRERIALAKGTFLGASQLKGMLDDYQKVTGNNVIVVIDACYSGSFIHPLAAPNRAIITSASEAEQAFFPQDMGFGRSLVSYLSTGADFNEAFGLARKTHQDLLGKTSQLLRAGTGDELKPVSQMPQLDDNGDGQSNDKSDGQWLSQFQINLKSAGSTFYVNRLNPETATTLEANQSITFKVMAGDIANKEAKAVWAIIRPSKLHFTLDANGTPFLILPRLDLKHTAESLIWEVTWNTVYNDDYEVSFYAEEDDGSITSSDENVIVTVTSGIDPPSQTSVQIGLAKNQYQRGEHFTVTVTENLGGDYDLYVAVTLPPDGSQYVTLLHQNEFAPLSYWLSGRTQSQPITVLDLDLPNDLPTGQYCLWAILSPKAKDVFATGSSGLWVYQQQCFELF